MENKSSGCLSNGHCKNYHTEYWLKKERMNFPFPRTYWNTLLMAAFTQD